jgi:hypothetical protein
MSSRLKGVPPSTSSSSGDKEAALAKNSKELLRTCLHQSIHHERTPRYFYYISAEVSAPPGCLSFLLSIGEADMVEILKICGFYNDTKGQMLWKDFEMWVDASFAKGTMEVASYQRKQLIKIGTGDHPIWPSSQEREKLDPPGFRMQTKGGQSRKDSLMQSLINHMEPPCLMNHLKPKQPQSQQPLQHTQPQPQQPLQQLLLLPQSSCRNSSIFRHQTKQGWQWSWYLRRILLRRSH